MLEKIITPKNVNLIIKVLENNGHEAYAVGGCVRDALMGREPQDWDITTSAKPLEVKALFHRTIDTGIKHGTVTVMLNKTGYEVTTYRIDGSYTDGRHPDEVLFTSNLVEDLKRRDFTINAMAYNEKSGIVDEFGGVSDLENKCIRCVGNPRDRFGEDALRMLRAVRFAAKLGFYIEENTRKAIKDMAENLRKISKERIKSELDKLIVSDNTQILAEIRSLGMDKYILDYSNIISSPHGEKVYDDIIRIMQNTKKSLPLRWAAFMTFEGENCTRVLKGLKFDNKTINICSKLICYKDSFGEEFLRLNTEEKKYFLRKVLVKLSPEIFEEYFLPYMKALVMAGIISNSLEDIELIEKLFGEIITAGDCLAENKMAVKGSDLIELGIEPGSKMGEIITMLFDVVLREPEKNTREFLLGLVKEMQV